MQQERPSGCQDGNVLPDILTEVLDSVSITASICGSLICSAPWHIHVPVGTLRFYAITEGNCRLEFEDEPSLELTEGDLVFLTQGQSHELGSGAEVRAVSIDQLITDVPKELRFNTRIGGGGSATKLICGAFSFKNDIRSPLLSALPGVLHVAGELGKPAGPIADILRLLVSESTANLPGGQAIVNRLVQILLTLAARESLSTIRQTSSGWLQAMTDPEIGRALALIHSQPEYPWTVALLADKVTMSRSVFAARFATVVGMPPLHYVVECRMRAASELLCGGNVAVKEIAARFGYRSQAAFRTAFKRWAGDPPGKFRRFQDQIRAH